MRLLAIAGIAASLGVWGWFFYLAETCVEDCGDSGIRGAFVMAVAASVTVLPIGIALLMPGSQRRSGSGRSVACWALAAGVLANALLSALCVALTVHLLSQGPATFLSFGVLPTLLFGAVPFGLIRWATSLR